METRVLYKAIADFSNLRREISRTRRELDQLRREESAFNTSQARRSGSTGGNSSVAGGGQQSGAVRQQSALTAAYAAQDKAAKSASRSIREHAAQVIADAAATREAAAAQERYNRSLSAQGRAAQMSAARVAGSRSRTGSNSGSSSSAPPPVTPGGGGSSGSGDDARRSGDNARKGAEGWKAFAAALPKAGLFLGVAAGIGPLISVIGALGGAAFGAIGGLIQLGGAAVALPGAFAALFGAIGGGIAATRGISNVFKAYGAQQKAVGAGAASSAQQQVSAARSIVQAQERLTKARFDAVRATEDAAERVHDANRALVADDLEVARSTDKVNDARQVAIRDLQDLREAVEGAGLSEERAIANLAKAREDYLDVMARPASTNSDKLDAAASVKEAEQALADVRQQNTRNVEDLAKAEAKGVEGSDVVVSALSSQQDAVESLRDARTEASRAAEDQGQQEIQNTQNIRDAIWALEAAQDSANTATTGGAAATDAYQAALDKLSPSAKTFVLGLIGMKDAWTKVQQNVQERFFGHIADDVGTLGSLLPVANALLGDSADALGSVADKGIAMVSSGPWRRDFYTLAQQNAGIISTMGDAVLTLFDGFRNLALVAGPFLQDTAESLKKGAANFRDWAEAGRASGSIADMLDTARKRASELWTMTKNVAGTLGDLTSAGDGFITWLLDGADNATAKWAGWAAAQEKSGSTFKTWLEDSKPLLQQVGALLSAVVISFGQLAADPSNIERSTDALRTLRTDVLPKIVELLNAARDSGAGAAISGLLQNLLTLVTSLMSSGAGGFLVTLVRTINLFATAINDLVSIPGVGFALGVISSGLGAIAAVKLVGLVTKVGLLGKVLKTLTGSAGLSTLTTGVAGLGASGGKLGAVTAGLSGIIGKVPGLAKLAPALAGGTLAAGALFAVWAGTEVFQMLGAQDKVAQKMDAITASVDKAASNAGKISAIKTAIGDLQSEMDKATDKKDMGFWGWVTDPGGMVTANETMKQGKEALDKLNDQQNRYNDNLALVTTNLNLTDDAARELADKFGIDLSGTTHQVASDMAYAKDMIYGVDGNSRDLIAAWGTLADKGSTLADKAGALGTIFDGLRTKTKDALDTQADFNQAWLDAQDALKDIGPVAVDAAGNIDTTTESGLNAYNQLNDLVSAGDSYIQKLVEQGDTEGALAANTTLEQRFDDLMGQMGLTGAAADTVRDGILGIPTDRQVAISATGASQVGTEVGVAQGYINSLTGKTVTMNILANILGTNGTPVDPSKRGTAANNGGSGLIGLPGLGGRHGGLMVEHYAAGGIRPPNFTPLPAKGGFAKDGANLINWAEPGTGGEALIPLGANNRPRSLELLRKVAEMFGYTVQALNSNVTAMANGGVTGLSTSVAALSTQAKQGEGDVFDPLTKEWKSVSSFFAEQLPSFGDAVSDQWKATGSDTATFWSGVTKTFQQGLGDVDSITNNSLSSLTGRWATVFGQLADTTGAAVGGITTKWAGINGALYGPIRDFVNVALNQWVLGRLNPILANLNVAQIPVVGLNSGGQAYTKSGKPVPGTGNKDTVPAILTPGEFVLRKAASAADGVLPFMRMLNSAGSNAGNLLKSFQAAGAQQRADGGTIDAMEQFVQGKFPWARMTSGYRAGDSGYHGRKEATDWAGTDRYPFGQSQAQLLQIDQAIAAAFPNSSELIHTAGGSINLKDGQAHRYDQQTQLDHLDHTHWAMKTLQMFSQGVAGTNAQIRQGSGGTVATSLSDIQANWPSQLPALQAALSELPTMLAARYPGGSALNGTFRAGAQRASDAAGPFVSKIESDQQQAALQAYAGYGGASRWAGVVGSVLRELGLPQSMTAGVLNLIENESGGDPNAINTWDSNAKAGHPSQGLMQTIPSTFAAYAGPYANRPITDPYANIYAGVSYALKRYGAGMLASGGRKDANGGYLGYATGGVAGLPPELLVGAGLGGFGAPAMAEAGLRSGVAGSGTTNSSTVNRGFHVEKLIVNNPRRERASDSLPRTIRKVAYLRD